MSAPSRWLNWTPNQRLIMETLPESEPTKPSKMNFVGFDGSASKETSITGEPGTPPTPVPGETQTIADSPGTAPTKPTKLLACPYDLPAGVRLLGYAQKRYPVAVTVCSVVTDVPKFIRRALGELDARLHNPIQIKAGDSVFTLVSKLADCGLEIALEWPPKTLGEVKTAPETATGTLPTIAPSPNAHGIEITDEDIHF